MRKPNAVFHFAYLVTIAFKGFDGGIELLLGLLIWLAGPRRFYTFVLSLTAYAAILLAKQGANQSWNVYMGF